MFVEEVSFKLPARNLLVTLKNFILVELVSDLAYKCMHLIIKEIHINLALGSCSRLESSHQIGING